MHRTGTPVLRQDIHRSPGQSTLRRPARRSRQRAALTLPELVIVTLIIGIMSAVSVPWYLDSLSAYHVEAAARRIKVDLEFLRQQARKKSVSQTVTFSLVDHSYTIGGVVDLEHAGSTNYCVQLDLAPYSVRLLSVDCGGDATLRFDGFGKPDSAATIVVSAGPHSQTVLVESTAGKVTLP